MSKVLRSAYITQEAYDVLEELARYRSLLMGAKNSRGQAIGAGTLIDEAVVKYAEEHMSELEGYRQALKSVEVGQYAQSIFEQGQETASVSAQD